MSSRNLSFLGLLVLSPALVLLIPSSAAAAVPVIDEFIASPAAPAPVPGQGVRVTLRAHDPDCATHCASGCGAYIRPDLLILTDNTGRTSPAPFANIVTSGPSSPFTATFEGVPPLQKGATTISAQVSDPGTFHVRQPADRLSRAQHHRLFTGRKGVNSWRHRQCD